VILSKKPLNPLDLDGWCTGGRSAFAGVIRCMAGHVELGWGAQRHVVPRCPGWARGGEAEAEAGQEDTGLHGELLLLQ
jgi:hypothetical protein